MVAKVWGGGVGFLAAMIHEGPQGFYEILCMLQSCRPLAAKKPMPANGESPPIHTLNPKPRVLQISAYCLLLPNLRQPH